MNGQVSTAGTAPAPDRIFARYITAIEARHVGRFAAVVLALGVLTGVVLALWHGPRAHPVTMYVADIGRWLFAVLGWHTGLVYLRMAIAHGVTRRRFFLSILGFSSAIAVIVALLVCLAYLLEASVLGLLPGDPPVTPYSGGFIPVIAYLEYWAIYMASFAIGLVVGVAFAWHTGAGMLAVLPGLVAVGVLGALRVPGGYWLAVAGGEPDGAVRLVAVLAVGLAGLVIARYCMLRVSVER